MKLGKHIYLLLFILISINSNYSQTEKPGSLEKSYTVLVMPFYENEHYPYRMDRIRESLMDGFQSKGFNIITDDSTWLEILEEEVEYDLSNISTEKAKKIADFTKTDLIVFGNTNSFANIRYTGISSNREIYNPLLIKVYDAKTKSLVIFQRAKIYEYWGLSYRVNSIYDIAVGIARDLIAMGY